MSGFGITSNIDNPNNERQPQTEQASAVPKHVGSIFKGMTHSEAIEFGLEDAFVRQDKNNNDVIDLNELTTEQYLQYLEENDKSYSAKDASDKKYYVLLKMIEEHFNIQDIEKYCSDNDINIQDFLSQNPSIQDMLKKSENESYRTFLNKNISHTSGKDNFLLNLYSSDDKISDINKKFQKEIKVPLDLKQNKEETKKALESLKGKFLTCKNNTERKQLINQLQTLTGIRFNYNTNNADIMKRAFAILYSLTMTILEDDGTKEYVVDGKKIKGADALLEAIKDKMKDKKYPNTIDKLGCFASFCDNQILKKGDDNEIADKIRAKVSEQRIYAHALKHRLNVICDADDDKKAKISEIIDPKTDFNTYLDINEYIALAEKALKTVDQYSDKDLKELKTKANDNIELKRSMHIQYLLKIYFDYKEIKSRYDELNAKQGRTAEEQAELDNYQCKIDNYNNFIKAKGIQDSDLDRLLELGEIAYEGDITVDVISELKKAHYGASIIKERITAKQKSSAVNELKTALENENLVLGSLSGLSRKDAIKELKKLRAQTKDAEIQKRIDSILKAYETLTDADLAEVYEWNNDVANGIFESEKEKIEKFNKVIANIHSRHPEFESVEDIVLMVTKVVRNMYQGEEYNDYIQRVTDSVAQNTENGTYDKQKILADLAESFSIQISDYASAETKAEAIAEHQDNEKLIDFALSCQGAQSVAELLQQMIQENPDAFSDEFKSKIASAMNEFNNGASSSASGSGTDASSSSSSGSSSGTGGSSDNYSYGASDPMNYNDGDSGNVFMRNWFNPDDSIDNPKNKKTTDNNPENQSSVVTNPFVDSRETNSPQNQKLEAKKAAAVSGKYQNGEAIPMQELVNMVKEIWSESPSQVDTLTWVAMSGNSNLIKIVISNITGWNKYLSLTPKSVQEVYEKVQEDKNMV